jgi:hypothetical protein
MFKQPEIALTKKFNLILFVVASVYFFLMTAIFNTSIYINILIYLSVLMVIFSNKKKSNKKNIHKKQI